MHRRLRGRSSERSTHVHVNHEPKMSGEMFRTPSGHVISASAGMLRTPSGNMLAALHQGSKWESQGGWRPASQESRREHRLERDASMVKLLNLLDPASLVDSIEQNLPAWVASSHDGTVQEAPPPPRSDLSRPWSYRKAS
eukprot:TRINITY_DN22154_c0_g1_i1.p1 TRINITY_DN22154_c0_g1~~TRINITY_DN22154_c0_g1_i1.p1  ORF type:complete len:140 (-),score=7.34 TRINITY_DN22154_c0_g1_i1:38-457(-)